MNFLDKIRNLPEEKRKRVSLISAFTITLFIILLWFGFNAIWKNQKTQNKDSIFSTSTVSKLINSFKETINF